MRVSPEGLKLIQSTETFEPKPYYCSAHVSTVGWGHALTTPTGQIIDYDVFGRAKADELTKAAMLRMFGKQSISVAEADALLDEDLNRYEGEVNRIVDAKTHQCEFDAMVSMCFNIGTGGFRSSAVARLHAAGVRKIGDISLSALAQASKNKAAPTTMPIAFVRWSNSNGAWTKGLFRRRIAELLVYGGRSAAEGLKIGWSYGA